MGVSQVGAYSKDNYIMLNRNKGIDPFRSNGRPFRAATTAHRVMSGSCGCCGPEALGKIVCGGEMEKNILQLARVCPPGVQVSNMLTTNGEFTLNILTIVEKGSCNLQSKPYVLHDSSRSKGRWDRNRNIAGSYRQNFMQSTKLLRIRRNGTTFTEAYASTWTIKRYSMKSAVPGLY